MQSLEEVVDPNENIQPAVLTSLIEDLATHPPRTFDAKGKAELYRVVETRFRVLATEMPVDVASALQLLHLPGTHQTFMLRLRSGGPKTTATPEAAEDLLSSIGLDKLNELEVSNALLFMIFSQEATEFNLTNFISAIRSKSRVKTLEWQRVLQGFDLPDVHVNQAQFLRLFDCLRVSLSGERDFDIQSLWGGKWRNAETQLSFLKAYLFSSPQEIDIPGLPNFRHGFRTDLFDDSATDFKDRFQEALKHPVSSRDAVVALLELVFDSDEIGSQRDSSDIVQYLSKNCLDIFMLSVPSIPEVPQPWSPDQVENISKCFRVFLFQQSNEYKFALEALWRLDVGWVFKQLHNVFLTDPMMTMTIFERAEEFGWTDTLLDMGVHPLTLDIACVRHQGSDFDLENWLREGAERQSYDHVVGYLHKYLKIKAEDEYRVQHNDQPAPRSVSLPVKTISSLLLVLEELVADHESLIFIQRQCLATYPRLINYGEGYDNVIDANGRNGNKINPEIDIQMSDLFGQMFRGELTFQELLTRMGRYKQSREPSEQELFTSIINGLFDEYQAYHDYPPDALVKTAVVFGSVINFKLISGIPLHVGLSLILEAVRENQPHDSMYKFGVEALEQLVSRLPEWIGFCSRLVQISALRNTVPYKRASDIMHEQGQSVDGEDDAGSINGMMDQVTLTNGNIDQLLSPDTSLRKFKSLHVDPALKGQFEDPDKAAQEKVLFVLNNISAENLTTKLKDLQDVLQDEHYQWFANHLVEQRAKLEPNFQPLYMALLDVIGDKRLMAEVLRETYVSAIKMLNAEATINSVAERGHLKNLGGWLGSLTIAKDKPVKHKNIYFKELLLEGFDYQRLVVVLPFTCKVLVQGAKSTVFKPPNPWLMDILALLMELYHYADLKLNLKFEIEVLCKDLQLDHKDIEPSTSLQDRPTQADDELANISGLPDGLEAFDELSLGGLNRAVRNERLSPTTIMSSLPRLESVLKYPPASPDEQVMVKEIVYQAFNLAISEIIAPVVERSITIASISTHQLIQKDFAYEQDEEKIRSAARKTVKSLAGSLALVTCKEPLRMSVSNFLRRPPHHLESPEQMLPEGTIMVCVNDNIDLACSFVEQAAEQRSIAEIDRFIDADLEERRRTPGNRTVNRWAQFIPDPFRQSGNGLNDRQLGVYEYFDRVKGVSTNHGQNASSDSTGRQIPDVLQEPFTMPNLSTPAEPPALPHQTLQSQTEPRLQPPSMAPPPSQPHLNGFASPQMAPQERIHGLLYSLQQAASEASVKHVKDLPNTSSIYRDFLQIVHILMTSRTPSGEILARYLAERICRDFLEGSDGQLEVEVKSHLLAKICAMSDQTAKDVHRWMCTNEENYAPNVYVTSALVGAGLVEVSRIDNVLSKFIRQRKPEALNVLADLMDLILFSDVPFALRAEFSSSLEAMDEWLGDEPGQDIALRINDRLREHGMPEAISAALDDHVRAKHDQMEYIFSEWVGICQSHGGTERSYSSFLRDMHQKQAINDTEDSAMFFWHCIDTCVSAFEQEAQKPNGTLSSAFAPTDALAKLVISLVKLQGETNGAVKRKKDLYLNQILSTIVLVLNHHYVKYGVAFNQRVFYRLFSCILIEYTSNGLTSRPEHRDMMMVFAKTFLALQPGYFPTFVYGWFCLIAHRAFLPLMLNLQKEEGWAPFVTLMQTMLRYIGVQLGGTEFTPIVQDLYKGVCRILLILHHDFPDFVAENHFQLCNAIPAHCTQVHNLILSAYPQSISELPDPFTPQARINRLDEAKKTPVIAGDVVGSLERTGIKSIVDQCLDRGLDVDEAVTRICTIVHTSPAVATEPSLTTTTMDTTTINSLALYIGQEALATSPASFDSKSVHSTLHKKLVKALHPQARYCYLVAMTSHLRYPNTHTIYFCKALLHIFGTERADEQETEIREEVVRIVLERLITARPHPWGMIMLQVELAQNEKYNFWEMPFISAAPEIRRLLMSIRQMGQ